VLSSRYTLFIGVLLATGLALNGFMAWQDRDLVRKGYPDFTVLYSAGKLVRAGLAASLYDVQVEFQTQRQFAPEVSTRHGALPYIHPPFEALLFVPLTFLPYFPAYLLWDAASLALLSVALQLLRRYVPLLRNVSLALWVLCGVAFFPIFVCLLQGQDMLLFFFLLAAAYVYLRKGADFLAGCCLGMGCFRPHLVLSLAIILLFSRRRKAVAGIACSGFAMAAASIGLIGWGGFLEYPRAVWREEQVMGRGAIVPNDMPNLRGLIAMFFRDGHSAALALIAATSVLLLVLGIWLFCLAEQARNLELGISVAVLVTILVSYHAFMYDLALLFLPALLLVDKARAGRACWQSVVSVASLFFTPLLMFLFLRLNRLNLLTPILLLWLLGVALEISRGQGEHGLESYPGAASSVPQT
jgi:Glycosyltransferase family 87